MIPDKILCGADHILLPVKTRYYGIAWYLTRITPESESGYQYVRSLTYFEADLIKGTIEATIEKMEQLESDKNVIYYPGESI